MIATLRRMAPGRRLLRDTSMLYVATIAAGVLQYGVLILLARTFGPDRLAPIVLATSIAGLIAASAEFGIGAVLIRYYAPLSKSQPELWNALARFLLLVVAAVVALMIALGFAAAAVCGWVGASAGSREAIVYGFVLAGFTIVLSYFQNFFQAQRRFEVASVTVVVLPLLRLAALAVLSALTVLTQSLTLGIYVGVLLVVVVAGWWLLPSPRFPRRADEATRKRARALALGYIRWTAVGRAAAAVNGNLGILMLAGLGSPTTTGVFAAASQTAAPLPMLGSVIELVSFPHLVARGRRHVDREMWRRLLLWLPVALGLGIACVVLSPVVLPAILGESFRDSVLPFQLLAVALALQVWQAPIGAMVYAGDRQRFAAFMAVWQLVALAAMNALLIPSLGATAPALAILVVTVVSLPPYVLAVRKEKPIPAALMHAEEEPAPDSSLDMTRV